MGLLVFYIFFLLVCGFYIRICFEYSNVLYVIEFLINNFIVGVYVSLFMVEDLVVVLDCCLIFVMIFNVVLLMIRIVFLLCWYLNEVNIELLDELLLIVVICVLFVFRLVGFN